jgi:protein XagA
MRKWLTAGLAFVILVQAAEAASWTVDRGHLQIFSGVTSSRAKQRFDDGGTPSGAIFFNKLLVQNWMEYGLTDAVTLLAVPEYVSAETDMDHRGLMRVRSTAVEAGARILLLSRIGMLSLQISGKSAGAFEMSSAANDDGGKQFELRLLYGRSFKMLGHDAFLDVQAAERWIGRPRLNERIFDATTGFWLTKDHMVMFQSFNMISRGEAKPPYEHYRLHKLQFSLVQRITARWAVQSGYFFALAGRNAVKEQGFVTTVWYRS